MKAQKTSIRVIALVVLFVMFVCAIPMSVSAALPTPNDMTVVSDVETTLAPGITQNETVIFDKNGKRVELFIATADMNVETVGIQSSYYGAQCEVFGMSKMTEQIADHQAKYEERGEPYTAVVGMNASYYDMNTGRPTGAFVMEGVDGNGSNANGYPFFAILKDGTPMIGLKGEFNTYKDQIWECVGANEVLVWDGVNKYESSDTAKYPRSAVGLTADNKVIFINANGNKGIQSVGLTRYELGQLFIELGCVSAVKYDEGGSATYVTKPQGSDEYVVTNTPSDGAERPISAGLIIYSTALGDGKFASAVLTAENTYVTPYSSVSVSAIGSDKVGGAAEVPEDAKWQLADAKYGTISDDGVFVSNGTVGAVKVQLVYEDKVVGETTINVAIPDLRFETAEMVVPYGKTFELSVIATTNNGVNEVVIKDSDIVFELSNSNMGSIDGKYYTTCEESSGVTGGTVTVKCVYDETKTASAIVTFGKASTILYDFENGSLEGWGIKSGYLTNNNSNPVFGRFEEFDMKIVDSTTGKVRNGEKALEIMCDYSIATTCGWKCIRVTLPTIDVAGATTVGMWIYIPTRDVDFLEVDIGGYEYYPEDDPNVGEEGWYFIKAPASVTKNVSTLNIYMTDSSAEYFNALNKFYLYIDDITLDYSNAVDDRENPKFSGVYISETADSNIAMNGQTVTSNILTIKAIATEDMSGNYTGLNVSSARVFIDGVKYNGEFTCTAEGVITLSDIALADGTHSFRFEIEDKAGNVGVITRQVVVNKTTGDVYLSRRYNTIQPLTNSIEYFDVIAEDIAKIDSITLTIDLDNLNKWELQGADVLYGFTMDYSVDATSSTATITLTRTGDVEAVGEAVIASLPVRVWGYNSHLIQKYIDAGVVFSSSSLAESKYISTPDLIWKNDRCRLVRIEMTVDGASVVYSDGTIGSFSSLPMNIITENNRFRTAGYYNDEGVYVTGEPEFVMQGKTSTHIHTAVAIDDKDATCTIAGYTGRTFCEGCNSVVEWGTIIPAHGHNYQVVDGALKCECDKAFNGVYTDGKFYVDGFVAEGWSADNTKYYVDGVAVTGVAYVDGYYGNFDADGVYVEKYTGKFYNESAQGYSYALNGTLRYGWYMVGDSWNYFSSTNYIAKTGTYKFVNGACKGITYVFDDEGNLTDGVWHTNEDGKIQYFYGPDCYKWANNILQEIDGKTYCFDKNGYLYLGYQILQVGYNQPTYLYHFDDVTGELIKIYNQETGIFSLENGNYCYIVNGVVQKGLGMITVDGADYYVRGNGLLAVGKFYIGAGYTGCGHLKPDYYDFGEDGKFIGVWVDTSLNGVLTGDDGELHYYVNGVIQKSLGLITVDGAQYYVRGNGLVAVGKYYIGAGYTGCEDLTPGYYDFGEDGKFVGPWVDTGLNGILTGDDGELHYYVNGVIQKSLGMITVDGAQYYVRGNGLIAVGKYYIGAGYTGCNHLKPGYYDFGEDGKFVGPWVEQGVSEIKVGDDGELHYYVNGVIQKGLGMITIDGADYYVRGNGIVATGKYYIGAGYTGCGHLAPGYYDFGEDGKFVGPWVEEGINGIQLGDDGELHYYVNGVVQKSLGLITVDGAQYYVRGNGCLATGKYYVGAGYTGCGHLAPGYYDFGEDGKFVGPWSE